VLDEGWEDYRAWKAYQQCTRFDTLCLQSTGYQARAKALKRLHQKKAELWRVLERPDIPLHTNAAEEGLRDGVKKRKVSAGPYSEGGRACRDHFASLKKTCLKLQVPLLDYLRDRVFKRSAIPPLADLIRSRAAACAT
jgi:hypothetical protein